MVVSANSSWASVGAGVAGVGSFSSKGISVVPAIMSIGVVSISSRGEAVASMEAPGKRVGLAIAAAAKTANKKNFIVSIALSWKGRVTIEVGAGGLTSYPSALEKKQPDTRQSTTRTDDPENFLPNEDVEKRETPLAT